MIRSVRSLIVSTAAIALAVVLWPPDAHAQRGRARPRVSAPSHIVRPYVRVYRPYYVYSPYSYSRWLWAAPWSPFGWYPAIYYAQYPYPRYRYAGYYDESSLRIQVKPKEAEVYVDGYFMGTVDSYDGLFQRLHVPPGEHVVEIFHEGYRPIRESMRFVRREGYELKREMEPLAPGDPTPVRPTPDPGARPLDRDPYDRRQERRDPRERSPGRPADIRASEAGAVAIRVQPAGAIVLIDGEKWEGPDRQDPLVVHLSEGMHRIEIQKEGYRPFVTEVRIRRGETVPLNVSLRTTG